MVSTTISTMVKDKKFLSLEKPETG